LRASGLDFVCAPVAARDGEVLHRLASDFSIAVFPHIEGRHNNYGEYANDEDRDEVLRMLVRLHAAPPATGLLTDDYTISLRAELDLALADLATPWTLGPLGEDARKSLADNAVHLEHALAAYDDFARRTTVAAPRAVITHGEPHAANVVFTANGPTLIDWDTVKLAPIERDLARVVADDVDDAAAYVAAGGDPPDEDRLLMYALWWDLNDVALYARVLRGAHDVTADTEKMLRGLANSANIGEHFPGLLD
jgi:thiamine kinase-like enzyme